MNRHVHYLLIGGGIASANAIVGIRELDNAGSIEMLGSEPTYPYDRTRLTSDVLTGEADPYRALTKAPEFYEDKGVSVTKGVFAVSMDLGTHIVRCSDGATVTYDRALIATGLTPKRPQVPGGDLPGVYALRTLDDAIVIRDALRSAKSVAIIGAGYVGMEVASTSLAMGKTVAVIDPNGWPWSKIVSEVTGQELRRRIELAGAAYYPTNKIRALVGDGSVSEVHLESGDIIQADLVLLSTGSKQNTELARNAGLPVDPKHGIIVDAQMLTADTNVFAAGDVACFPDPLSGEMQHIEHYCNAKWQGKLAGRNMAGAHDEYKGIPVFHSKVAGWHVVVRGQLLGTKPARVIGDRSASFVELYENGQGQLSMAVATSQDPILANAWSDHLEKLIRQRIAVADVAELPSVRQAAPQSGFLA